jgi:nucleoside-diphosphate-sugar epimerase
MSTERQLALVTGGNGFIGSHLVEALLKRGYRVRCLVRKTSNLQWLKGLQVEYVYGDITVASSLPDAVDGVDYVYHLAGAVEARDDEAFFTVNVQGTRNLLQACVDGSSPLKRFVLASSQSASGPCEEAACMDESDIPHPISPYGRSNLKAEGVVLSYADRVPVTIIRPPAVYGPRDTMILAYFKAVQMGIKPLLGLTHRKYISLVYVCDLIDGFLQAAESGNTIGEVYFIGDEKVYSRAEILDGIATALSVRAVRIHVPDMAVHLLVKLSPFIKLIAPSSAGLSSGKAAELVQKYWLCDVSKARRDFGFETKVGLQEGLKMTAEWYKKQGWL